MSDTSLVFNLIGRDQGVSALLAKTSTEVRAANVRTAASVGLVTVAAASATAQVIALASGMAQATGSIIALPALAITAAAGIGALKLGVMNLGAALKSSGGAAGGAAFDYAAAERRVAMALRTSLDAQEALDAARADAARNIAGLTRSLNGARLDEQSAVLAVANAEVELRKARARGNRKEIEAADLAYRQSVQTLEEAKARTEDLGREQQDAATKGVEGSDAVKQALQRQSDATYELAEAKKALAKGASGGGADPAAAAFAKLAPSAKELVTTIKAISPAWQGMQRSVQQAVWAGVAGDLKVLSAQYLPVATQRLGQFGTAWNTAIRSATGFAKTPGAIRQTDLMLGNAATAANTLGRAVAPILSVFLSLGSSGSTVLPRMADAALQLAERFERWMTSARESGKLAQWAGTGLTTLKQLGLIAWNVAGAVVAIFRAGGASDGAGMLAWLAEATGRMSAFLNSTEGQDKIKATLETLRGVISSVVTGLRDVDASGASVGDTFKVGGVIIGFLADNLGLVAEYLPEIAAAFVIYKAAQLGANIATMASIPLRVVELVNSWGQVAAMKAHTAALTANTAAGRVNTASTVANTAATNAGMLTRARAVVGMIAERVAKIAGAVATGVATAAQWLLNIAMMMNPVGLIVLAIIALIAIFVLLWTKCAWFRDFWIGLWEIIKVSALAVWSWLRDTLWPGIVGVWDAIAAGAGKAKDWIVGKWDALVAFLAGVKDRITAGARGMWDGIVSTFKGTINFLLSLWNRLDFGINIRVPDWVPGMGGKGFSIADIIPDIPLLDVGGEIRSTGLAVVHQGEQVVPAAKVAPYRDGGGGGVLRVEASGGGNSPERALADIVMFLLRKGILVLKVDDHGRVQVA